jgi:hypothetical protein
MRLRTLRLRLPLTLALVIGFLVAGVASSETKVGSDVNVRTVVSVKIAEAEAQKLLPQGWQVNPFASGANQGANLTLTFIDELLSQDAEGKAKSNTVRRVAVGMPAKNAATGAAGNNVVRVLTTDAKGLPGPYKTSAPASLRLEQSIKATDMEPAMVTERWEVRDQSGGTMVLALEYTRGVPTRTKAEPKVYGGPDPAFFRIYRFDSGGDVLRSVPTGVDRVKKLSLRVTTAELKKAFDGTEQIVSVVALPWYQREVSLP